MHLCPGKIVPEELLTPPVAGTGAERDRAVVHVVDRVGDDQRDVEQGGNPEDVRFSVESERLSVTYLSSFSASA